MENGELRNENCTRNKFQLEGLEIIEIVDLPTQEFSILNSMRQHGEMEFVRYRSVREN